MLSINDLKTGTVFEKDGKFWQVLEYQHSKTGRAGAILRTKLKNIVDGSIVSKNFQASDKFIPARILRKKAQFLYQDNGVFFFMDSQNYEQFSLKDDIVGNAKLFLREGDEVQIVYCQEKPITIELPIKIKLKVVEAPEADKGNTAQTATKKIKLETGLEIDAPLFIKANDSIIVDTRDGSYVERA